MTRRTDAARQALGDMARAVELLPAAEVRLMDARAALPGAASYDGDGIHGPGNSSPVERLIGDDGSIIDPTARDRKMLDQAIRQADTAARTLLRLTQAWTPHAPTSKDQAAVEAANDPTPECAVTRDLLDRHEPMHRVSDVGGILPAPLPLGRWVYDFVRTNGRKPTMVELDRHRRGQPVRVKA